MGLGRAGALISLAAILSGCSIGNEYGGPQPVPTSGYIPPEQEACHQPKTMQPFLPWPPPPATGMLPLETTQLANSRTVGEVADKISSSLFQGGYRNIRYYSAEGGFAIATGLEKIDETGTPASGDQRYNLSWSQTSSTYQEFWSQLVYDRVGYFREFVFVVSSYQDNGEVEANYKIAQHWADKGCDNLSPQIRSFKLNSDYRIAVLSYVFDAKKGKEPTLIKSGEFGASVADQLNRSGVNLR